MLNYQRVAFLNPSQKNEGYAADVATIQFWEGKYR